MTNEPTINPPMPVEREFREELYNRLTTIFERTVGISLDIRQIDRLNDECKKLGDLITKQINFVAQKKALEVCKLLNDATQAGFKVVAADIAALREQTAPEAMPPQSHTPKQLGE